MRPKEARFVEEYLKDFNQTKAVIRAGYAVKNDNVAHVIAQRLLQKATVRKYLEVKQEELAARNDIAQDFLVIRLKSIIENVQTKPGDKIRALTLLARITGFFKDEPLAQQTVIFRQTG